MRLDFFEADSGNFINVLQYPLVFNFEIYNFASNRSLSLLTLNLFFVHLKFYLSFFRLEFVLSFTFKVTDFLQLSV
jgi:hypothetical protein